MYLGPIDTNDTSKYWQIKYLVKTGQKWYLKAITAKSEKKDCALNWIDILFRLTQKLLV